MQGLGLILVLLSGDVFVEDSLQDLFAQDDRDAIELQLEQLEERQEWERLDAERAHRELEMEIDWQRMQSELESKRRR